MLRHDILQAAAGVIAAPDMDVEVVPACVPLCIEVRLSAQTAFLGFSTVITSAWIRVPRRGLPAIAVVLREVHFSTAWSTATRVAIAADTTIRTAEVGQVKVVVHIPMGSRQVHVPLDISTASHVE